MLREEEKEQRMDWPEKPHDVGDCYLLVDDRFYGKATLAFALYIDHPEDSERFAWALIADDGDIYRWEGAVPAGKIVLIRRVRDGLDELIPEEYRARHCKANRRELSPLVNRRRG